jgi:hypothetical protein
MSIVLLLRRIVACSQIVAGIIAQGCARRHCGLSPPSAAHTRRLKAVDGDIAEFDNSSRVGRATIEVGHVERREEPFLTRTL